MSAHRCFTAWNDPIDLPELLALLGVVDRQLGHPRGEAELQRGGEQRTVAAQCRRALDGADRTAGSRSG